MNYATANDASKALNELNDCAVKAVSIATGVEYSVVHRIMKSLGRRNRCATKMSIIDVTVEKLGFKKIDVRFKVAARTISQVPRDRQLQDGNFLVTTSRHILAVTDGVVQDWTKGRQHRVREVARIVPMDQPERVNVVIPIPAIVPAQPKQTKKGTVKWRIHATANVMWKEAGSPKDIAVLRTLRKQIMDTLEEEGIKRTSASTELGQWQKLIIA